MEKRNLIFIGMPAAGKSTIGKVVAKRFHMQFIDVDLVIQEKTGKALSETIAEVGNEGFLQIENQVNCELSPENAVISPGGSIVYNQEAMEHYKEIGTIVYLKVPYRMIARRIPNPKKRGIVLKKGQSLFDLYKERKPLFEKYADITVSWSHGNMRMMIAKVMEAVKPLFTNSDSVV